MSEYYEIYDIVDKLHRGSTTASSSANVGVSEATLNEKLEESSQKILELVISQVSEFATANENMVTESVKTNNAAVKALSDKIANLQIGGRNLLLKTKEFTDSIWRFNKPTSQTLAEAPRVAEVLTLQTKEATYVAYAQRSYENPLLNFNGGETLTVSMDVKASSTNAELIRLWLREYGTTTTNSFQAKQVKVAGTWEHITATFTVPTKDTNFKSYEFWVEINQANTTLEVKNIKLETGSIPTDWTPAPEDLIVASSGISESKAQELITAAIESNNGNMVAATNSMLQGVISEAISGFKAIEVIEVSSTLFDLTNGYPFTGAINYTKTYVNPPLVVPVQQFASSMTGSYQLQAYDVTNTSFKMRINTKLITPTESSNANRVSVYAVVISRD